jgi:hypothetical protein
VKQGVCVTVYCYPIINYNGRVAVLLAQTARHQTLPRPKLCLL